MESDRLAPGTYLVYIDWNTQAPGSSTGKRNKRVSYAYMPALATGGGNHGNHGTHGTHGNHGNHGSNGGRGGGGAFAVPYDTPAPVDGGGVGNQAAA